MKYLISFKTLKFIFLFLFINFPVIAETNPDDIVGVYQFTMMQEKHYFKKWKDIKIDDKNKEKISAIIKRFEKDNEKFRVNYIFLSNGNLTRLKLEGEFGTVIMMDYPKGKTCSLNFIADGGYAGTLDKACND